MKILIILGSTRKNRVSERIGKWVLEQIPQDKDISFELVDLRNYPLPFFDEVRGPSTLQGNYETKGAKEWAAKVAEGDGFIFITPEYNHGYSAVMKNALDYVYQEWNKKPVAFVSYGGIAAGTRAVMQLTQVVRELQMVSVREGAHLPMIWNAFAEDGSFKKEYHLPSLEPLFTSLVWWTKTLWQAREGNV